METNNKSTSEVSSTEQIKTLFQTMKYEDQLKIKEWMEEYILKNTGERVKQKMVEVEKQSNSFFAKLQDKFNLNK